MAKLMARMFGIRELLLGIGVLSASAPAEAARWMRLGSIADAVDGAAVVATWRHLPRRARYANVAMAFGAAAANVLSARRLEADAAVTTS